MKPSKNALFNYFLGLLVFTIGVLLAAYWNRMEIAAFSLGACNMLFIFGIHNDIYEEEKPNV
jgi:hypothetical protein